MGDFKRKSGIGGWFPGAEALDFTSSLLRLVCFSGKRVRRTEGREEDCACNFTFVKRTRLENGILFSPSVLQEGRFVLS